MFLEILIIFIITYSGILLSQFLSLPIPGTIVGMLILLTLLITKFLKVENIEKTKFALFNPLLIGVALVIGFLYYFSIPLDYYSKGVAIGISSHVGGTTKAMEMGEVEGAISALSIVIAGVITLILSIFIKSIIIFI